MRSLYAITLALFVLGFASPIQADTLNMPGSAQQTDMEMPGRGMSMDQVRAKFGQPRQISPAVGEPPITRWVYDGYTVYFEHHLVIHSVRHRP